VITCHCWLGEGAGWNTWAWGGGWPSAGHWTISLPPIHHGEFLKQWLPDARAMALQLSSLSSKMVSSNSDPRGRSESF